MSYLMAFNLNYALKEFEVELNLEIKFTSQLEAFLGASMPQSVKALPQCNGLGVSLQCIPVNSNSAHGCMLPLRHFWEDLPAPCGL